MQEMLEYLIKLFQIRFQTFNLLFRELDRVIRYLVHLIESLMERLVDLYLEIVYKPQHGKT
jgi:hypothetical protein